MNPEHLVRLGLLLPLLGIYGGPSQALTQAEKDAFLSREKWYVSFSFSFSGSGGGTSGLGASTTWSVSRSTSGSLLLNNAIPGQWPLSIPAEPDFPFQTGRFITWMTVPTDAAYAAMERGESEPGKLENHYYPIHRETSDTLEMRFEDRNRKDTWNGISPSFAMGPCMLALDLEGGVYDVVFAVGPGDFGSPIRHVWSGTDGSGQDDAVPTHHMAWIAPEFATHSSARNLRQDMKADGSIAFTLTGRTELHGRMGAIGPTAVATFRFSPTPPTTAKLILEPEPAYSQWRPEAGDSEINKGNGLAVYWKVEESGLPAGQKPKVNSVTFRLSKVSRYPGVCMNWPLIGNAPNPPAPKLDLAFAPLPPGTLDQVLREEDQVLIVDGDRAGQATGTVDIECYDGAAIGELVAEAQMVDGRVLQCEIKGQPALRKLLIPDREEGVSELAKHWRSQKANGLKDEEDLEQVPAGDLGQGPGDGLTVWEEYRGFRQGGRWQDDCLPAKKDLFIDNRVGAAAQGGIDMFAFATRPMVIHDQLLEEEHRSDRVINWRERRDRWVVDQHCLVIQMAAGSVGVAVGEPGTEFPGPPKNTKVVNIIPMAEHAVFAQASPTITLRSSSRSAFVAHEIGHGVGIYHHGDKDVWSGGVMGVMWYRAASTTIPGLSNAVDSVIEGSLSGPMIKVLGESNLARIPNDILFGRTDTSKLVVIGKWSGQHSGDGNCFMRYDVARAYELLGAPDTRIYHGQQEYPGDDLCSSPAGTLVNHPDHSPQSRYGGADTGRGDCIHQFVISDQWEIQHR